MGLERREGGQTACQGGRGGQDPTRGATSVFQHCSLREFALCGRRTGYVRAARTDLCAGCGAITRAALSHSVTRMGTTVAKLLG